MTTNPTYKDAEFDHCYLCGETRLKVLERYHQTGLVRCQRCGFVFSKWIPTIEFLIDFYNKYPEYQHWNEITSLRYRQLMDRFEKFRQTNNLLDVGSGEGLFLDEAQKKNWNVFGTEFIDRFIDRCRERGMIMHKGKLDVNNYKPESMDIILWIEVIEHINDPVEELKKFKTLLRPGGVVYLTTPNFNSISRLLLKEELNLISYPNHLAYYTPSTLKYLFEHNGFRTLKVESTGMSPGRILKTLSQKRNEKKPILNKNTQQIDEPLRERIESSALLKIMKNTINAMLTATGTGESLKGLFQKM